MKELIINVPEDTVEFVEEFVGRIGGTIQSEKAKRNPKIKLKQKNLNHLIFLAPGLIFL